MNARLKGAKTVVLTIILTTLVISLVLPIIFWRPIFLLYSMIRDVPVREKALLYQVDHKQIAAVLRTFAAEQRWNDSEKHLRGAPNFYYGNDPRLPDSVRALRPSWVQISDDRIDVGCGLVTWDVSKSFGISVWREGLSGWGTKKLAEGVWFYSDDNRVPSRFSLPW